MPDLTVTETVTEDDETIGAAFLALKAVPEGWVILSLHDGKVVHDFEHDGRVVYRRIRHTLALLRTKVWNKKAMAWEPVLRSTPRRAPVPVDVRFDVLRRDRHTCRYCGRSAPDVKLHVDHVVPKSKGGSDDPANLVAACQDCNLGKSNRSLTGA